MTLDVLVRREPEVTESERALVVKWGADAFGAQTWTQRYAWSGADVRLFLLDGGTPVSHLKIVLRRATVGGGEVLLAGVGSVMTPTELRRRGYSSALLRRAAAVMFDGLGVDLGMLFCLERLVPFYAQKGWIGVRSPVWIEHPEGRMVWPEHAMVLPRPGVAWTDADIDVRGLPW